MGKCLFMRKGETHTNPGSRLPRGYTELAFIRATGTQYIDSKLKATEKTKVTFKGIQYNRYCYVAAGSGSARFGIYLHSSGSVDMAFGASGYIGSALTGLAEPVTVTLKNGKVSSAGKEKTFTTQGAFTTADTIKLFALTYTGDIYAYQHYEGDVLVRDYVPCINPSGEIGMYDLVTAAFFGNAGTGEFIGSEVA